MTNAILRGKLDAGNPHIWFDEGDVASAKPRRGSLLYRTIGLACLAVTAFTAGVALAFPSAVTFVEEGEMVTLAASTAESSKVMDSGSNKFGSFVYAKGNGTLKVTVPEGAKKAIMWSALFVTNGVLTLDLTDVAEAGIPYYQRGGIITKYEGHEGTLRVKGLPNLVCGDKGGGEYERFEATSVSFVDENDAAYANGGSMTFTNRFVLLAQPNCPWSIAKGEVGTVCVGSTRVLDSLIKDNVLSLDDFTLRLIGQTSGIDPSATIKVGANRALETHYADYPTKFSTTPNTSTTTSEGFFWGLSGHGTTLQTIANPIDLASSAKLNVPLRAVSFEGAVTGAGNVLITTPGKDAGSKTWFKRSVKAKRLTLQPSNTAETNPFDLRFFDSYTGELALAMTNCVAAFAPSVGSVTSEIKVIGYATTLTGGFAARYPVVLAQSGATVKISADSTGCFRFRTEGDGKIEYKGLHYTATGYPGVLVENGKLGPLPASVRFSVPEGKEASGAAMLTGPVKVDGKLTMSFAPWKEPQLWLDAAAAGTVSNLYLDAAVVDYDKQQEYGYDGTVPYAPVVTDSDGTKRNLTEWWSDRRGTVSNHAYFDRHRTNDKKFYQNVYPVVVQNGLNGLPVVSMNDRGYGGATRRIKFYGSVNAKFAFIVFGSSAGGGNAILVNPALGRGADEAHYGYPKYTDPMTTNTAFKTQGFWADGERVDPTVKGFSGDWQILSIDLSAVTAGGLLIDGLGYCSDAVKASGRMEYAEVMLFDEVPSEAARVETELYLARKWGLLGTYKGATASSGAALNAYGSGEIVLDGLAMRAGGVYSGTVTVGRGSVLEMPTLTAIPTETEIGQVDGLLSWFDPDQEGAIKYHTTANFTKCLEYFYDRVQGKATGVPVIYSGTARAPSVETRQAAFGPARKWVQYGNVNPTETEEYKSNAIRIRKVGSGSDSNIPGVQMAFMVMDSSQGGGCPILDNGMGGDKIKRFTTSDVFSKNWAAPIWNPTAATTYFDNGATYLNGNAVNGRNEGFTGGPELLTAVAEKAFAVGGFAGWEYKDFHYKQAGDTDAHTDIGEIEGEIILYGKALSDADRQKVEAYLMYKWLGYVPNGSAYGDVSALKVSGVGTVKAASVATLPTFDGFTGTVEVGETAYAASVAKDGMVTSAFDFGGGTAKLPAQCALAVTVNGVPPPGWYTVARAAGGLDQTEWTITTNGKYKTEVTPTEIRVKIPSGLLIVVQ